jgi:membrane-associated phospholipid phosphatase
MVSQQPMALTRQYTFVDSATQGYAAFVALLVLFFHNATVPNWLWIFGAHLGILLCVHGLIQWNHRAPAVRSIDFLRHFYPVLLFAWFFSETAWLNRMFFSQYMDAGVIRLEQALFGFQPSVVFMQKLPYLAVSELFYASYFCYYVMIGGVGIALYLRDRRQFFHYVSVISFVFYICYTLYIILPIIGPRVFFYEIADYSLPVELQNLASSDTYPEAVQTGLFFRVMAFIYRMFEAPGAALPSSHVAIALATVFFSFRYLRKIRYPHLIVAVLLCFSTVYCRYHYALDVAAGVLTAVALVPLGNWLYFRNSPTISETH